MPEVWVQGYVGVVLDRKKNPGSLTVRPRKWDHFKRKGSSSNNHFARATLNVGGKNVLYPWSLAGASQGYFTNRPILSCFVLKMVLHEGVGKIGNSL